VHSHRFRDTLATRLDGDSSGEPPIILGNTAEVIRRHYGKWSKGRQANIDRFMVAHFQKGLAEFPATNVSHKKRP
jgi:hypothetical protein